MTSESLKNHIAQVNKQHQEEQANISKLETQLARARANLAACEGALQMASMLLTEQEKEEKDATNPVPTVTPEVV